MKSGSLFVDGQDVYTRFGVFVVDGGWNELVSMPPLKAVDSNDWQEEDGIEVDLSSPVLNSREVSIRFAVTGLFSSLIEFIDLLSDGGYHKFICSEIGREFKLRLLQQPNLKGLKILGTTTLKFADDFPLDGYEYSPPKSSLPTINDYSLDGIPFSGYGVRVLKGTYDEIVKSADVKLNLLRDIRRVKGVIYDAENVTYKSKDVRIQCLLRADSLDELWRNFDALLFDLSRPNARSLWVDSLDRDFTCHYKNCSVTRFAPNDRIWLQFTLTLTFTEDFRIREEDIILATEDDIVIITNEGESAVNIRPD